MRLILASLAAAISILSVGVETASAQAANPYRPFCIRDGVLGRGTWDCTYYSMQQCMASQRGAGGTCQSNPWYAGPGSRRR